jgi:tripartite-type tricarboxylate transporter receptor subunit TctC
MAFAIDKIKPELLPSAKGLARLGVNNDEGGSNMITHHLRLAACGLALAVASLPLGASAQAQDVASFYRGKTVQAVVGYPAGSTFELYLRMFARHVGKHIPGNPNVVIQHMPGAGSLTATSHLANVAAKDGSVFGMPNPVNTIEPLLDPARTKFDPTQFSWIGNLNTETSTCSFWANDIKTLDDLRKREVTVGSTGPASGSTIDAVIISQLLGLKLKVVTGYRVINDIKIAAERGEVDGFCGLLVSALKTDFVTEWKSGRISVPVQMGLTKHPDIPNVPNAYDLVTKEEDRQLFQLIFGPWAYGRPMFMPPGVPAERLAAMRAAFKATLSDPEFISETQKIGLEINPSPGDAIVPVIQRIMKTPEPVVMRARQLLAVDKR